MHDTRDSAKSHCPARQPGASPHVHSQGPGPAGNEAPDRSLQSPFAPRVASPESCSEDAYWQEEAQLTWDDAAFSNLTPPAPASPDRNSRQPRSSGGKLAYVVFGDQTTGVYYNWVACNHKLNHYAQASFQKPRFLGYASYEEAESAWAFYLETRIIPHPPADGGVSATPVPLAQPTTPQRNRGRYYNLQGSPIPAVSSRPPHYPLIPAHRGSPTPVRGASSPARSNVTSPPPLYAQLPPLSQPRTLTVARRAEEASFFVVIVGYNPGVYAARHLAQYATGALNNEPIVMATSRQNANQIFIDAYMTDRVRRLAS